MIICEECEKELNRKVFCSDRCRMRYVRKANKGVIIVRKPNIERVDVPKPNTEQTEPDLLYEDMDDYKGRDD